MATSVVQKIANAGGVGIPVSLTTSMGATTTEGILLGATNTATAGAQVFSPSLHFQGSGWKTAATAGAQSCDWYIEATPVEDSTRPVNQLWITGSTTAEPTAAPYLVIRRPTATEGQVFVSANGGNATLKGVSNYTNLLGGVYQWDLGPGGARFLSAAVITWASSATSIATGVDTGLSRISAGVVGVGTGAAGSIAGGLSLNNWTLNGYYVHQSPANGAQLTYQSSTELLTLSTSGTTTDTSASLLPANAIIDAVVARVITTITTATSWQLGDPTTAGRFTAANSTMAAGTTDIGTLHYDNTGAAGRRQVAAAKVRVTTVGTPGAGAIRITVFYHTIVPPSN